MAPSSSPRLLLAATVVVVLLSAIVAPASAADTGRMNDFCVADVKSGGAYANAYGLPCKNPKAATADDFFFPALSSGSTSNRLGFNMTLVDAAALPGLNTLGISIARLGFAPRGVNPPHVHPRATEVINVIDGALQVGFVSASPENKLFIKTLRAGDVFVFPAGLVHFQLAGRDTGATAISVFSSESPGQVVVGDAMFGSKPSIPDSVLHTTLNVGMDVINQIKAQF